ncbi:Transcription factor BIM2 isoform B [Glycine soja]|uniref:Transcription factor BIM2 isoform B n=1 Tax=Glycine soja TaxID=3848 RepID=A0A445JJY7_GLYSO|nr:Transcription factor BIM2 isoform B [Glycine soja]
MARSAKGHQDEFDEDDEEELLTGNISSKVKVDEPSTGKRVNPHRSKHSETEQRRRSKINERFQVLRDLIPQNDQKRDKASFLLEEKIQIYEQTYEGWNQEPTKLTPWRNHHGPAENTTDPSQASQNGSVDEKNNNVSPLLPKNVQNLIESDFSMTTIQKDHTPGSTTEAVPLPMQMRLDMFDPIVSSGMATQHLQEPVSNVNMPSHTQPQLWLNKQSKGNYIVPHNDTMKEQEELVIESGSDSISSAYSQGILDSLTQALHSSGVDMSQTNVSVQIDVGRRANSGLIPSAYTSKGHENQFVSNPAIARSGVDYCNIDSEQSSKRLRQEAS